MEFQGTERYYLDPELGAIVNMAIAMEKPLLLTGEAGTGKTQLAFEISRSMLPYVDRTRLLFAKLRDRFKRRDTYFFHNTVYGSVYKDPQRRVPLPTEQLLRRSPETRLLILGDAAMAPDELLYARGAITWDVDDGEPSLRWLERLRDRFRHAVWLNPIAKENWPDAYGRTTIERIGEVFRMEDLTLGGIRRAVEWLSRG